MDTVSLPPFWDTRHDSDLTIRLISARQSERRAEGRLIRSRLRRLMIEQELYSNMDKLTTQKLHKANISLGIARGVLRSSGLTPAGNTNEVDSDASSMLHESDAESDLEPSSWDYLLVIPSLYILPSAYYTYVFPGHTEHMYILYTCVIWIASLFLLAVLNFWHTTMLQCC